MNRSRCTTACAVLLLAPLAGLHAGDASKPPSQPNVIVLLTDDQGSGDLGCHGNPVIQTPHLDRLSRESVRFSNFHVDSYCTPTIRADQHRPFFVYLAIEAAFLDQAGKLLCSAFYVTIRESEPTQ